MKYIVLSLLLLCSVYGKEILISTKDIPYHQILDYNNLINIKSDKNTRCTMFDKQKLLKGTYQSKRYIIKGYPICNKDVQRTIKSKIRYDFGNIIIERDGKIIGQTKQYVKVKNSDGTVEKIYKNGRLK